MNETPNALAFGVFSVSKNLVEFRRRNGEIK